MEKIKNCPFCCCAVTVAYTPHYTVYFKCLNKNCGVVFDTGCKSAKEALEIFNNRCKGE